MASINTILRLNAASCIGFGAMFIALPGTVAAFLASPPAPSWLIAALGAVLVVNGIHLLHSARRDPPASGLLLYFSLGDAAWVAGTLLLIVLGLWINSPLGIAAALAVAAGVGAMGWLQYRAWQGMNA